MARWTQSASNPCHPRRAAMATASATVMPALAASRRSPSTTVFVIGPAFLALRTDCQSATVCRSTPSSVIRLSETSGFGAFGEPFWTPLGVSFWRGEGLGSEEGGVGETSKPWGEGASE